MKLSIIIPAHNEAEIIEKTLSGLTEAVKTPNELIVVPDHCTDATEEIVRRFALNHSNVKVRRNSYPKGFGNALRTGFKAAEAEAIVVFMADDCDDPKTVDKMHHLLTEEKYDLVCASRYMKGGGKISGFFIQSLLSSLVAKSFRLLTGIPTWDVVNSFKMYQKNFLEKINYDVADCGTEYSMLLASKAYFSGAKIAEIPTTYCEKETGIWRDIQIFKRTWKYGRVYLSALLNKIKHH